MTRANAFAYSVVSLGILCGVSAVAPQPPGHPGVPAPKAASPAVQARPADVASMDAIVGAFYGSTSGAAGEARDWERLRSLFVPGARMIAARPTGAGADAGASAMVLTVDDYVESNRTYFEKGGFFEKEVARRTEAFGNIAHVFSTYESRHTKDAPEPYSRGIYSIQLLKDGQRWWIVSVFWDFERPESLVPEKYLHSARE